MNKTHKYIKISELAKILNLTSNANKKPQNHILRFWEREFRQIKPKIINNQRYYSSKQVELIKFIKFLLKNKGMTINGVKNILNSNINKLDDYKSDSLKAVYYKDNIKDKTEKILEKIKKLKKYGKKNSY
tara:strand:+ start:1010 stop:1399 length:390 start_codon:yes stop_codon:yes gene_type:complete